MSLPTSDPGGPPGEHPLSAARRAVGVLEHRKVDLCWDLLAVPAAILIAYDVAAFQVEAFRQLGVAMPQNIGRSVRKRQAEFFMGRLAARDALDALDGEAAEIAVGALREPIWPAGIIGSITHAGGYAAAVAASADRIVGIGIDIERTIGTETRASVENTVVSAAEQALLHASVGELRYEMLLTLAFSGKESFFKGTSATVGSYFDFNAVELSALDIAGGTLELTLARNLAPPLPQGRRFTLRHQCIDADTVLTSFAW